MTFKLRQCLYLTLIIGALSLPKGSYAQAPDAAKTADTINEVNNLLPDEEDLNAPRDAVSSGQGQNNPRSVTTEGIDDDDVFYDADALVPTSEMSRRSIRSMDPVTEPASRMIIVKKDSGPSSHRANLVSANRAIKLGRYESALQIYTNLLKKNKRDVNALMGRAVALQKMERYEEAILAYDAVLDIRPDYKDARINKLGLLAERYPAVALRQLKELYQNNTEDIGVLAQLALVHANLGEVDQALTYLGVAASREPENPLHIYNMAIVVDRAGMSKQAVKYYEQALEIDTIYSGSRALPRDVIYTRLGKIR